MGRSPNESIQVVISDAEVDIDPVKDILGQILEDILCHLDVDVAFGLVSIRPVTDLNTR